MKNPYDNRDDDNGSHGDKEGIHFENKFEWNRLLCQGKKLERSACNQHQPKWLNVLQPKKNQRKFIVQAWRVKDNSKQWIYPYVLCKQTTNKKKTILYVLVLWIFGLNILIDPPMGKWTIMRLQLLTKFACMSTRQFWTRHLTKKSPRTISIAAFLNSHIKVHRHHYCACGVLKVWRDAEENRSHI